MSSQGLESIDHAVHLTHEWINELADRLGWASRRSALRLMRVTLHAVRDHLRTDELAQLSAQLPMVIRGIVFEGWVPKRTPVRARKASEFIAAIEKHTNEIPEYSGSQDLRAVFDLLNARISLGEVEDVRSNLPEDIRRLWPAP